MYQKQTSANAASKPRRIEVIIVLYYLQSKLYLTDCLNSCNLVANFLCK